MKRILCVLIVMVSWIGFAQNDAEAKALLDEVSAKVKKYENITIDFKYELDNTAENVKQTTIKPIK